MAFCSADTGSPLGQTQFLPTGGTCSVGEADKESDAYNALVSSEEEVRDVCPQPLEGRGHRALLASEQESHFLPS